MSALGGAPPDLPIRPGPIFAVLRRHQVDFVVVGGLAGSAHGSSYPTYDLDVAYSREAENLERMAAALRELEVRLTNAPADLPFQIDATSLANGANFTFDTPLGRFDILGHLPGIGSYESLADAAVAAELEGELVRVASIDHLISMKRAAGRPKDELMLDEYIVIADEQGRDQSS